MVIWVIVRFVFIGNGIEIVDDNLFGMVMVVVVKSFFSNVVIDFGLVLFGEFEGYLGDGLFLILVMFDVCFNFLNLVGMDFCFIVMLLGIECNGVDVWFVLISVSGN